MEASVAMADSLAEGVPDVCRSLADDERIRSRWPQWACLCYALLIALLQQTAAPTGNAY